VRAPDAYGSAPANACLFVALDDDRDRRAPGPDPRHRCFAVPVPEPRALPHQQAYCLTPNFPNCPFFIDWASKAAAAPVPGAPAVGVGYAATGGPSVGYPAAPGYVGPGYPPPPAPTGPELPQDVGARAWAGQPVWTSEAGQGTLSAPYPGSGWNDDGDLFGTSAPPAPGTVAPGVAASYGPPPSGAAPAASPQTTAPSPLSYPVLGGVPVAASSSLQGRPSNPAPVPVSSRQQATRQAPPPPPDGEWSRGRSQAYPALGSRARRVSPILIGAFVLGVAALALFLLPGVLAPHHEKPQVTKAPVVSETPGKPTPTPTPTPVTYTVKSGDSLTKIARNYGVDITALACYNGIRNLNSLQIGQTLLIPPPEYVCPAKPSPSKR
jgi:LysM domain